MILRDKKVIFIHIPKTGGQTILRMLLPPEIKNFGNINYEYIMGHDIKNNKTLVHATYKEFLEITERDHADYEDHFKFAMVRNPWDRVVSLWAKNAKKHGCSFGRFVGLIENKDYGKLKKFFINEYIAMVMSRPQSDFLLIDGEIKLDKIYYFEDYENEIKKLQKKIGIDVTFGHTNKSKHDHYSEYYNSRLVRRVAKIYQKDIELFKYKFINHE